MLSLLLKGKKEKNRRSYIWLKKHVDENEKVLILAGNPEICAQVRSDLIWEESQIGLFFFQEIPQAQHALSYHPI